MKELLSLLENNQIDELKQILSKEEPCDVAEFLNAVPREDLVDVFRLLPKGLALKTFVEMEVEEREILVEDLFENKYFIDLKPLLTEMEPSDLAEFFKEIPETQLPFVFRLLPRDVAADTFVALDSDLQEILIKAFSDKELQVMMDELFIDDAVDIIEDMPVNVVIRMLGQADKETRDIINEILKYPKDSAGSIMTIEFVSLNISMTVAAAFDRIRKTGVDKETIYTMYVTDDKKKLIGTVSAKDLLLAPRDARIGDIMNENVIYVDTMTDKEEVSNMIAKYGFLAMPVVDGEQRLVGIVTVDDAIQIMQDESTEDIAKMSAVTPSDKPYLKTGIFRIWLNRVPWLLILMVSATFTGIIISSNEETLNMPVYGIILTACIPMLMDTGGNAGSQASVTIIRGIALGELRFRDIVKVIWKEARVSILLGLTLAAACFIKLMAIDMLWKVDNGLLVAFVVCLSMFLTIVLAKLIGCILPLVAKKCRLDPAVVASPFITTIVDALSLLIYFGFANLILPMG